MDQQEARTLLTKKLAEYRSRGYAELIAVLDQIDCLEATGPSGAKYQIEVQFMWDGKPHGDLRVSASIDDGGLSALTPLCEDFIVSPNGRYVGE